MNIHLFDSKIDDWFVVFSCSVCVCRDGNITLLGSQTDNNKYTYECQINRSCNPIKNSPTLRRQSV